MKLRRMLGLVAFSLLAASEWLWESAFPSQLPDVVQQCLRFALIAAIGLFLLLVSRGSAAGGWPKKAYWQLALAGLLLFVVPFLLREAGRSFVSATESTVLYTLAPVLVVLGVANLLDGSEKSRGSDSLLVALLGPAGALLILPVHAPGSEHELLGASATLLGVLSVAAGSLWSYRLLQAVPVRLAVALMAIANAVVLAPFAAWDWPRTMDGHVLALEAIRTIALVLPQVFLLVWLLRELTPVRASARFLLVPCLTVLEGMALLRPSVDLRTILGVLLMLAGSVLLFLSEGRTNTGALHLG